MCGGSAALNVQPTYRKLAAAQEKPVTLVINYIYFCEQS